MVELMGWGFKEQKKTLNCKINICPSNFNTSSIKDSPCNSCKEVICREGRTHKKRVENAGKDTDKGRGLRDERDDEIQRGQKGSSTNKKKKREGGQEHNSNTRFFLKMFWVFFAFNGELKWRSSHLTIMI